jgi:hypothetical protein
MVKEEFLILKEIIMSKAHTVALVEVLHGIDVYNTGHGHVWPRKDGNKVRCLGPSVCKQCTYDSIRKDGMQGEPIDTVLVGVAEKYQNPTTEVTYDELKAKLDIAIRLLTKAYLQFKYYEKNHREKMTDPSITKEKLLETFDKAEANAASAKEIKDQLDEFESRQKT